MQTTNRTKTIVIIIAVAAVVIAVAGTASSWLLHRLLTEARHGRNIADQRLLNVEKEIRSTREFIKVIEADARRPRQWEYRVAVPSDSLFDSAMAEYGRSGWELVAARRASSDGSMAYEMIFRRPTTHSADVAGH
jgi:hypothetical protein